MTNIHNEIATSCLHDLIVCVFGRDPESEGSTRLGCEGTSSAVEYPANQTPQEKPNDLTY